MRPQGQVAAGPVDFGRHLDPRPGLSRTGRKSEFPGNFQNNKCVGSLQDPLSQHVWSSTGSWDSDEGRRRVC